MSSSTDLRKILGDNSTKNAIHEILHHLFTSGTYAVNGYHQNQSKELIKTLQWFISNPVHQKSSEAVSYRFLANYCDVFITCLNPHSDGTHSKNEWCKAKFLQISSNEQSNTFTSLTAWVNFQKMFIFGWTIPVIKIIILLSRFVLFTELAKKKVWIDLH